MQMKWLILTCDATKKIVGAQKYLLKKYVDIPDFEFHYLDLGDKPVSTWAENVYNLLKNYDDERIIFGLDDYLPIDYFDFNRFKKIMVLIEKAGIERYELGWGASRHQYQKSVQTEWGEYMRYTEKTPYSVSCQFSVWRLDVLKKLLKENPSWTPWDFEIHGRLKHAACHYIPVFRWIEESALSGRHPGKVNILGLRPSDVDDLINLGLINKEDCQYGMPKGEVKPFDPKNAGIKYQKFYEEYN